MATDLDTLMDLDPLSLTKDPAALDAIIAYHRNNRARAEAEGPKGRRKAGPAPKGRIDLTSLIQGMAKPKAEPEPKPAQPKAGLRRL